MDPTGDTPHSRRAAPSEGEISAGRTRRRHSLRWLALRSVLTTAALALAALQLMQVYVLESDWRASTGAFIDVQATSLPYEYMLEGQDQPSIDPVEFEVAVVSHEPLTVQITVTGDKELRGVTISYPKDAGFAILGDAVRSVIPDAPYDGYSSSVPMCFEWTDGKPMWDRHIEATEVAPGSFTCNPGLKFALEEGADPGFGIITWLTLDGYSTDLTDVITESSLIVSASSLYDVGYSHPWGPTNLTVILPNECGCGTIIQHSPDGSSNGGYTHITQHDDTQNNKLHVQWRWTTAWIPSWIFAIAGAALALLVTTDSLRDVPDRLRSRKWADLALIALPLVFGTYPILQLATGEPRYWPTIWLGAYYAAIAAAIAIAAPRIERAKT